MHYGIKFTIRKPQIAYSAFKHCTTHERVRFINNLEAKVMKNPYLYGVQIIYFDSDKLGGTRLIYGEKFDGISALVVYFVINNLLCIDDICLHEDLQEVTKQITSENAQ